MTVNVKICGITDKEALLAAEAAGASHIGLMFYAPSPRAVDLALARDLAARVPAGIMRVGVFVDPEDALLDTTLEAVPLDYVQLHGSESRERVAEIKRRTGKPIIKAVPVANSTDVQIAHTFEGVADFLLFDAKPPKSRPNSLPGGTGLSFDWRLLSDEVWPVPWFLAGGLTAENVSVAIMKTGARFVDVSSGVEDEPGKKNPDKIRAFVEAAQGAQE
ncbi:MAG: phosphoribosylanthranilate isomerase [Alphaproteobacteria bacterium]